MVVLIVTGHPAQIHNFRPLREELIKKGHKVIWVSSNKDISIELLNKYNIHFYEILKPKSNFFSKLMALLINTIRIIKLVRKFKVNFILSRVSPFAALAGFITRKKHVALADTEISGIYDTIFSKFVSSIITSISYGRNLRSDQIRIASNIELFYLHPNRFKPELDVSKLLPISKDEKFSILRFVSWEAYHDKGLTGFSNENKVKAVKEFSKFSKVFISSEQMLPPELEPYRISIPIDKMHDVLSHASLFFGEGASMAAESSVLSTPAIFMNDNWSGNALDLINNNILYAFKSDLSDQNNAILKGIELLSNETVKTEMLLSRNKYLESKIDATGFLLWFIENFPLSKNEMLSNPKKQFEFH